MSKNNIKILKSNTLVFDGKSVLLSMYKFKTM